jgi:hypothetical protein
MDFQELLIYIVPPIFLLVGLYLIVASLLKISRAQKSKGWAQTSAEVQSSKFEVHRSTDFEGAEAVSYHARVVYKYTVNGIEYRSDRVFFGQGAGTSKAAAKRRVAEYVPGNQLKVYYDPENPKVAVLEPGLHMNVFLFLAFGVAFTTFSSFCLIILARQVVSPPPFIGVTPTRECIRVPDGVTMNVPPDLQTVFCVTPAPVSGQPTAAAPALRAQWTSYTNANYVYDLVRVGDDLWAATEGGVLRWNLAEGTRVKYTAEHGLASNSVEALAMDGEGALWFGTRGGVSRFDGQNWTTYTTEEGLASNSVHAIAVDGEGALWFGTEDGGVSCFDGENWTTYTEEDGLANNRVEAIAVDGEGALWFGTRGGVSRFRPE